MLDIAQLQRQTKRYELADGVRDWQSALWIAVMGIYAWLVWDMPALYLGALLDFMERFGRLFSVLVVFGIALALPLVLTEGALRLMNEWLRRRWLWRETGIIKPAKWILPRRILFAEFVLMLVVFLACFFIAQSTGDPWFIIKGIYGGMGIAFAYGYWALGGHYQIARYRPMALLGSVGTIVLMSLPLTAGASCLVLSLWWSAMLMLSGAVGIHQAARSTQERQTHDGT